MDKKKGFEFFLPKEDGISAKFPFLFQIARRFLRIKVSNLNGFRSNVRSSEIAL